MIAQPRRLALHELEHRGALARAGQEHEELMVRLRRRVEPGIMIVEKLVDRRVGRLGRDDVLNEWRLRYGRDLEPRRKHRLFETGRLVRATSEHGGHKRYRS